jgi:sigma-B regulation protein RsbU (phosphoserine phosphatase)
MLLMLTDGFEEAVNPEEEMFGTDAVLEIVKKNRDRSAAEIVQILHDKVRAFTGNAPQLDDLTAILVKVK